MPKLPSFIFLLLSTWIHAQMRPFEMGQRWGLINSKGDTVSPALFSDKKRFCDSLYFVKNGSGWHVMHENGDIDYQKWYSSIEEVGEGKALIIKNDTRSYSLINTKLEEIFPFSFTKHYVYPLKKHLFLEPDTQNDSTYLKGRVFYVFDEQLTLKFALDAFSLKEYAGKYGTLFCANFRQGFKLLNENGKELFSTSFDEIEYTEGMDWFIGSGNGLKGVYAMDGRIIIPPKYQRITTSSDSAFTATTSLFAVRTGENQSLILDRNNQPVLSLPYETEDFCNEGTIVSKDSLIIKRKKVETETRFGICDWNAIIQTPLTYSHIDKIHGSDLFAATEKNDLQRLISVKGKEVYPHLISNVSDAPIPGFLVLTDKNGNSRLFNKQTYEPGSFLFDDFYGGAETADSTNYFYEFYSGEKSGLADKNGKLVLPCNFEYFELHTDYTISATNVHSHNKRNYSYYDLRKSTEPLFEYDELMENTKGKLIVMKEGKNKIDEYYSIDENSTIRRINYP